MLQWLSGAVILQQYMFSSQRRGGNNSSRINSLAAKLSFVWRLLTGRRFRSSVVKMEAVIYKVT